MPPRIGERPATTPQDIARVTTLLEALDVWQSEPKNFITIPGAPYSKSRPRFSRNGRPYHDPNDKVAEQKSAVYLRATVRRPLTGNVALACLFFRPNKQRIDTDNLLKHVCDAANGILWIDDVQCTALTGVVDLDRDEPRTVVALAPHNSGMVRDLTPNPTNPKGGLQLWD